MRRTTGVRARSWRPHRAAAGALFLAGALLASGCAGRPRPRTDLAPILPASPPKLATAPPAARDALEAGLRWITADAPTTAVGPSPSNSPPVGGPP